MPARTGYVQPAASPPWGYPYAGSPYASTSTSPYSPPYSPYAQSSFSASPGPMSPPPLNHSRSPYACAPLPALSCDLNAALSAISRGKAVWDVSYDPTASPPVLSSSALVQSATSTCLPYFTITLDPLPFLIAVRPSSSKAGAHITVADVLYAIYRDLRRPVRGEEFALIPSHVIASARQAFDRRLAATHPAVARSEALKGIRRIDFLMGNSVFAGLVPTAESPDSWRLIVSS
ncbi:hypothetical protein K438DRAFT_1807340 [Mycena galopus ATCC 62051]|nr:hypothetical protein K438DRAFT_1807340 [Mycena galopus ATCC 62051]